MDITDLITYCSFLRKCSLFVFLFFVVILKDQLFSLSTLGREICLFVSGGSLAMLNVLRPISKFVFG